MNINQVTIAGRVTRKPELRALPSGTKVCQFSIASNHVYFNASKEKVEEVEFSNCVAFAKTAETIAQYVEQGQVLLVQGRLKTSAWEKDGIKRTKTEIMVNSFQFGQKSNKTAGSSTAAAGDVDTIEYPDDTDPNDKDIPF